MNLQSYLDQNWTAMSIDSEDFNEDMTIAMISTNDKHEFMELALQFCPQGTTDEEIDDKWYVKKVLLLRHFMSKNYIKAGAPRIYNKLKDILEKRDARHWSSDSKIRTIDILKPNDDIKVTISEY